MSAEYLISQRVWRVILPGGTVYAVSGLGPRGHGTPRTVSGGRTGQRVLREIADHVR